MYMVATPPPMEKFVSLYKFMVLFPWFLGLWSL